MIDAVASSPRSSVFQNGGDEVARAGLGRDVVAQGELDARDGGGGVCRESAQAREDRCMTSLEKRGVDLGNAQPHVITEKKRTLQRQGPWTVVGVKVSGACWGRANRHSHLAL